ncbi:MAG: hypothetical protein ACI4XL_10745 [Bacillus sp. (in: firmicutes)]
MKQKRTVIMTGAVNGIGKCVAQAYCAQGYNTQPIHHESDGRKQRIPGQSEHLPSVRIITDQYTGRYEM